MESNSLNFLTGTRAAFILTRTPDTTYTLTEYNIPGVLLPAAVFPNPYSNKPVAGDKLEWEDLSLSFIINENMTNWEELYNWMIALGAPYQKSSQYDGNVSYTDCYVEIFNSQNNKVMSFKFVDAVPVYLSSISMSTTEDGTMNKTANLTLKYDRMEITRY